MNSSQILNKNEKSVSNSSDSLHFSQMASGEDADSSKEHYLHFDIHDNGQVGGNQQQPI